MPLTFEWDPRKARSNFAKHDVGFEKASTIFGDPLSLTIPARNIQRQKSVSSRWALPLPAKLLVVVHTDRGDKFASLARDAPAAENARVMKKDKSSRKQMRNEYDFSQGERGKYARRYVQGTNVGVREPGVDKWFPNSKVVNVSLRG